MRKTWLAVLGSAVLVSGVIAAGPTMTRFTGSGTSGAATGVGAGAATDAKPVAVDRTSWAGTKQFMQVQTGRVSGGAAILKVRPAKKVILGESFETAPIPGPYTEVTVPGNARILMLDGESGLPATFVAALGKRTAQQRGEAFDITFDAHGKVTLVEWLYVP